MDSSSPHRSRDFLIGCIWSYRKRGFLILALGIVGSLNNALVFSMVKPMMDMLFVDNAQVMISGLEWISPNTQKEWITWLDAHVFDSETHRVNALYTVCGISLALAFSNVLLNSIHRYMSRAIGQDFQVKLFKDLYQHILKIPFSHIQSQRQGDMLGRFSVDVRLMQDSMAETFQILLKEPFLIASYLITCFLINWKVTLFATLVFPVVGVVVGILSRKVRRLSVIESSTTGDLLHHITETLGGMPMIRVHQSEEQWWKKLQNGCFIYLRAIKKMIKIEAVSSPAIEFLGHIAVILVLCTLAPLALHGEMSPGSLFTIVFILGSVYKPLKSISNSVQKFSRSLGGTDRYLELLDITPENDEGQTPFPKQVESITFNNLNFSYPSGPPVIRDFSISIKEGQTVAIVGSTGAGKSTLMQLLPRFYEASLGSILIANQPITNYSLAALRSKMALVSQEVFLFNDSVYHNISMGQDLDRGQVIEAARAAHAHEFIEALPQGYDTPVGDRGTLLSGGQCQRISIARAVLKNPPILLLDEATSSLDSKTEKLVQEAVDKLSKGRTTLVIAHRLSTIQNADLILVMEHGELVESGTHEELVQKGGVYTQLHSHYQRKKLQDA